MTAQRFLAALLTFLFFALVIVGSVAIARALGHPGWGWVIGIGCCVLMVFGFWRQSTGDQAPSPPDHRRRR